MELNPSFMSPKRALVSITAFELILVVPTPVMSIRDEHLSHPLDHYLVRNESGKPIDIKRPPFDVEEEQS